MGDVGDSARTHVRATQVPRPPGNGASDQGGAPSGGRNCTSVWATPVGQTSPCPPSRGSTTGRPIATAPEHGIDLGKLSDEELEFLEGIVNRAADA